MELKKLRGQKTMDKNIVEQIARVFPVIQLLSEQIEGKDGQLKREQHLMRIKNMELREINAKTTRELAGLKKENGELREKVVELEQRSEKDCLDAIKQVELADQHATMVKKVKLQVKRL